MSFVDKIYSASPAIIQNIGISIFGWQLRRKEYGRMFEEMLSEFEKSEWYSADELRQLQNGRLKNLIEHVWENVPYYRRVMEENGLKPKDVETVDDLQKFPMLTKGDIRKHSHDLIATNIDQRGLKAGHTGGTTGSPLSIRYDLESCVAKNVVDWRQKRTAGMELGDKLGIFWGRILIPGDRQSPPYWRSNWAMNQVLFSTYHLSRNNLPHYIHHIREVSPCAIEGYPSTLFTIARFLQEKKETLPLRVLFTSSETLFPHQREALQDAFECEIFDYYGMAERVLFATECSTHSGLHLNDDFGITEIVDGNRENVGKDQVGRIVATGLYNYAMPLIRYVTSDMSSISSEKCSCGRAFSLLGAVTSRADDMIQTKDGRYLSFASLSLPFKQMKHITEAQIIQESLDQIRIKVVCQPGYQESDSEQLRREFAKRIGETTDIKIELAESIPRSKSGKLRFAISKLKHDL